MNIFKKLKEGLSKTRQNIVAGFDNIFSGHKAINDDFYDELEEVMIMGDMGVHATDEILEELKAKVKEQKIKDPEECRQLLIDTIKEKIDLGPNAYDYENTRSALLIIGVNGVGKTTSVGKLAATLKNKGKKVVLAAADTFRAGAIDQLKVWGKRAGVDVVAQQEGADPGAVIFDAVQASKARDADVLIADTAGRLHNKKNLMNELSKIDRIIEREYPECYRENLIVLDATTGQNAISQLKEFNEVTDITGIILTKMDGTAKGGIIIAIQAEFGIPVKYIGVGEKIEDLQKFDSASFVNALFDVELSDEELNRFEEDEIDETLLAATTYDDIFENEDLAESESIVAAAAAETEEAEEVEIAEKADCFAEADDISEAGSITDDKETQNFEYYSEDDDIRADEDKTAYENSSATEENVSEPEDIAAVEETQEAEEIAQSEDITQTEEAVEEYTSMDEPGSDMPDNIFEDITDDEDELLEDDTDDNEPEVHRDKAYEAFMRKRHLSDEFEDDEYDENFDDNNSYSEKDYDEEEDEPVKKRGLFGIFRKKK